MWWDEMRLDLKWLLIDDEDDVWIVCDFNIQHSIFYTYLEISYEMKWRFSHVSFYESYNFVDCNLLFVICICIYRLTSIIVQECLAVDLSMLHLIWYDMIWYDMIWYDITHNDMILCIMIWYDITHNDMILVCPHVGWEAVVSTYLSFDRVIDLIQLSLSSSFQQ